jgi:hypothetical protein
MIQSHSLNNPSGDEKKLAAIAAVSSGCVEQEKWERMAGGKGLREG